MRSTGRSTGPVGFRHVGGGTIPHGAGLRADPPVHHVVCSSNSPFHPGQRRMTSRVLLRRTLLLPIAFATFAVACSDDKDVGPGSGSFTLGAPSPTEVTLAAGTSQNVTIPVTFTGGMNPVTLTADSVPAGIQVGFLPS